MRKELKINNSIVAIYEIEELRDGSFALFINVPKSDNIFLPNEYINDQSVIGDLESIVTAIVSIIENTFFSHIGFLNISESSSKGFPHKPTL